MKKGFSMLYDNDIVSDVRKLINEASTLKSAIFRTLLTGTEPNKQAGNFFISYVNGYLQFWEDFALDMKSKMSAADPGPTRSIPYSQVKDFIYDKYDYAAMLKFAEGISMGITDGKFKDKSDIDDFFACTVSKAFGDHDQPDSAAALLDSVLMSSNNWSEVKYDSNNLKMFNAVKNYRDLVDRRDRVELFTATKKVVEFISDKDMVDKLVQKNNVKLYVATINSIMEFVVYSLTAYAVRVYAINTFAYPFINNSVLIGNGSVPAMESASDIELPTTGNNRDLEVTIMRDADEAACKEVGKSQALFDAFGKASTALGADGSYSERKPSHPNENSGSRIVFNLEKNLFGQKLFGNNLYQFITRGGYSVGYRRASRINEMNTLIKTMVYNPQQGISTTSSPKQEFLAIIRGVDCDNTVNGYRTLFANLYEFVATITINLEDIIDEISYQARENLDMDSKMAMTQDLRSVSNENLRVMSELYSELVYTFIQKARDIETRYNKINSKNVNDAITLNLRKANAETDIGTTTSDISNAVPDSNRIPIDLTDLYTLPAFESYQYYDEAVKVIYGLEDDFYFSEAFNFSTIVNAILALIAKAKTRMKNWWNNVNRQKAVKWVTDNANVFNGKSIGNQSLKVMPFITEGNKENININPFAAGIKNLSSFNDGILNSPESVQEFLRTKVYPNPVVYDWFHPKADDGNKKPEDAKKEARWKLHNWILYTKDVNAVKAETVNPVEMDGPTVEKKVPDWINTIKGGDATFKSLDAMISMCESSVNNIKSAIANIKEEPAPADKGPTDDKQNNGQPSNPTNTQNQQNNSGKAANGQMFLTEMQMFTQNVLDEVINSTQYYFDTCYRQLQDVYNKVQLNTSQQNNGNQQ